MSKDIELNDKNSKPSLKRGLSRLSPRTRRIIRYLIIFLCVFGLFFQTTELAVQYSKGQTVVNIKIETIKYNRIPAITICYPAMVSMERTAQNYPELRPLYDEYKNSMKNVSEIDYKNETLVKHLNEVYHNFTSFANERMGRVKDMYDLSIPFEIPPNSSYFLHSKYGPKFGIEIKVKGMRHYPNESVGEFEVKDLTPIQSIKFINFFTDNKCFTFFSHLNQTNRQFQMDIYSITIDIRQSENWFPPTLYERGKIWLSMHSPNTIPNKLTDNNFLRLKADYDHNIAYNRWKTVLLPPPYQTNCNNYDMDGKQGYRLRSDCINYCIHEGMTRECGDCPSERIGGNNSCTECVERSDHIWRKDNFNGSLNDVTLCDDPFEAMKQFTLDLDKNELVELNRKFNKILCQRNVLSRVNTDCQLKCPPECISRYYNYEVKSSESHSGNPWKKYTMIRIIHNQMPDQINENIPEMTFISFAANFGGLLGMWLGLSALALLHYFIKLL